jgi:hypothetical protein
MVPAFMVKLRSGSMQLQILLMNDPLTDRDFLAAALPAPASGMPDPESAISNAEGLIF